MHNTIRDYSIERVDLHLINVKLPVCCVHYIPPINNKYIKNSLKIPKGQSESVYRRRTDNTMAKRKSTKGQTMIYKTYI